MQLTPLDPIKGGDENTLSIISMRRLRQTTPRSNSNRRRGEKEETTHKWGKREPFETVIKRSDPLSQGMKDTLISREEKKHEKGDDDCTSCGETNCRGDCACPGLLDNLLKLFCGIMREATIRLKSLLFLVCLATSSLFAS